MKHKRRQLRPAAEETDSIRQGCMMALKSARRRVGKRKRKCRRSVRQALIDGNYQPRAIRRMDIPKPDGGVRTSGIPTVVDRLIQQAVQQAQRYIRGGKRWVVDMDLEKFFDRVDHRLLMTRLARTIKDRRVL